MSKARRGVCGRCGCAVAAPLTIKVGWCFPLDRKVYWHWWEVGADLSYGHLYGPDLQLLSVRCFSCAYLDAHRSHPLYHLPQDAQ